MSVKTSNGMLNFLYRIFIEVDDSDNTLLDMNSSDPTERALAESDKATDEQYKNHFSGNSGKGKDKFKLDESELNKDAKSSSSGNKVQEIEEEIDR